MGHLVELFYTFDFTKRTISVEAIAIDANLYVIPALYQNVAAVQEGWTDFNQAIIQVQLGLTPAAGEFSETFSNMRLMWS